ncbi:MAG: gamma-glutamylcyclotransferase [Pseudomonadota bacterium]
MTEGIWVFGYGSLMWRPGFAFGKRSRARVHGLTRRLCVLSVHHRGTERRPGLVLGLDRGGACDGIAFWVPANEAMAVRAYLKSREQVNGVYREARVKISLLDDLAGPPDIGATSVKNRPEQMVMATTFIAERAHPSYQPELRLCEQARIVTGASGLSGHNIGYVVNTVRHLRELAIKDPGLERLMVLLGGVRTRASGVTSQRLGSGANAVQQQLPKRLNHKPLRTDERRRFLYRAHLMG